MEDENSRIENTIVINFSQFKLNYVSSQKTYLLLILLSIINIKSVKSKDYKMRICFAVDATAISEGAFDCESNFPL